MKTPPQQWFLVQRRFDTEQDQESSLKAAVICFVFAALMAIIWILAA